MDPDVELEQSGLSGSNYKPSDADDEENEDVELEADEPDTQMPQTKERKKEKPGIVARNQIQLIREQEAVNDNREAFVDDHAHEAVKRKASISSNMHANIHLLFTICITSDHQLSFRSSVSKKSKVAIPVGVISNWEKDNVLLRAPIAKSDRAASASSFSSRHGSRATSSNFDAFTMNNTDQSEDIPAFQHRGIVSDDDDELEHHAVIKQDTGNVHYRVCVLSSLKQLLKVPFTSLLPKLKTLTMPR